MSQKLKLTDAVVRRAELPQGRTEAVIWDTEVAGFGLRLRGTAKTYIVCYRPAGAGRSANTKRFKIGTPETIKTATEARRLAFAVLGRVAAGGDPARDRREERRKSKSRVGDLLDAYEKALERRHYVMRKMVMSLLRRRLVAHVGKDIRDLTGVDYAAIIQRLEKDGFVGAADDFRSRCRTFLTWCVFEAKVLDSNPLFGYTKGRDTREEKLAKGQHGRALSDDEFAAVWQAARPDTVFGRYVRFLMLTGCRRNEGAGLTRGMYAEHEALLRLPATFTKQARGHDVHVDPALAGILKACPLDARSDLFFPSPRTGQKMSGWNKRLGSLVKTSGVRFTLHDLRRTFRTGLSRLGVDSELAELALGHARADLEARYNRDECTAELKKVFGLWAGHIAMFMSKKGDVFL